jgi:mannose-6-phosphate isomerase
MTESVKCKWGNITGWNDVFAVCPPARNVSDGTQLTTGLTMSLYPLKFKPRMLRKMWGGRKLETVLRKSLPEGPIGESWELYDFPPGVVDVSRDWVSSEVAEGPLSGKTLHQLVGKFGRELYGDVSLVGAHGQFPILIKFLDAKEDLSVQVHPDEAYAKANPGAHLKNEAWYVVQADAGSRLLKGLKPGVTRESFGRAIGDGSVESTIHSIPAKEGDCFYLPSGTVHALGAGILAAEVQTPSDSTYRVFDFNRVDPSTGKTRTLHVEQALKCIDFNAREKPETLALGELAKCEYFTVWKRILTGGKRHELTWGEPIVLMFLEGRGQVASAANDIRTTYTAGETILIPALLSKPAVAAGDNSVWIEVRLGRNPN